MIVSSNNYKFEKIQNIHNNRGDDNFPCTRVGWLGDFHGLHSRSNNVGCIFQKLEFIINFLGGFANG